MGRIYASRARRGVLVPLLGLLAAIAASAHGAGLHKCRAADGSVSYSDRPCATEARAEPVPAAARSAAADASIVPQCGRSDVEWQDRAAFDVLLASGALPPAQQRALGPVGALLLAARDAPWRWRRSASGDLHFCGRFGLTDMEEVVAGANGAVVGFRHGERLALNTGMRPPNAPDRVLARCSSFVTRCYSPPAVSLDQCFEQAPDCSAEGDGSCCPRECKAAFRERRAAGEAAASAMHRTLFGAPGCVPGLSEALDPGPG